jgi:type IV pilus assembly protein PilA
MVKLFKFLKTKKGFSLVELMIVVVIMAILVAVAVPIFNSVTGSAREKTCIDNQRQAMGSIDNLLAGYNVTGISGQKAVITFGYNGDDTPEILEDETYTVESLVGEDSPVTFDIIKGSFKTVPVCGDSANTITLTINPNPQAFASCTVSCSNTYHELKTVSN